MNQIELRELEELKSKCLTAKGDVRQRVDQASLSRFRELEKRFNDEHSMDVPDGAKITEKGHKTVLNVCGKQVVVDGPPR